MAELLSPDHVFDFPTNDPAHELEDPYIDVDEDPEEDPEEVIPSAVASPPGSPPISPPPLLEGPSFVSSAPPQLLGYEVKGLREDTVTLYGSVRTFTRGMETRWIEIVTTRTRVNRVRRRIDVFDVDITFVEQATARVEDDVIAMQTRSKTAEARLLQLEITRRGAEEARPTESIDVLVVYGDARPLEPQGPSDARGNARVAGGNARGAGGNIVGNVAPEVRGCTYKTLLGRNTLTFSETEGTVGLSRWIEKIESVFQISKCAHEDKVRYGACTLHGRALIWWNGYVYSLGIDAANQISWTEFKQMMTDEYCPRNELQRMEHEL
ncbi:hypothetical protein Tco_0880467 [Tanacetum coccineum]